MADRYDNSFSRRPQATDGNTGRRNEQPPATEDDPLVELARIVSGKSSFDDIVGSRAPAAPTVRPAQAANVRDTSFDLESELMNDLQSSFDPAARSPSGRTPPLEPQPPRAVPPRDPGFDHMGLRPGAPAAPPQWQPVQPPRQAEPRYQPEPRPAAEPRPRQDAYAQPAFEDEDPYAGTAYAAAPDPGRDRVAPAHAGGYYAGQENGADDHSTGYDDDYRDDPNGGYDDGYDDDQQSYGRDGGYDEPRRSRKGLVIAAAGLAIVLAGGLGALALKGGGGSTESGAPRVIAAEEGPTKVQPAAQPAETEVAQNKLIYDRASPELAGDEQLVLPDDGPLDERPASNESEASREISRIILPGAPGEGGTPQSIDDLAGPVSAAPAADLDSGPRKVRTVVVKPDGTIISSEAQPRGGAAPAVDNAPAAPQPAASAPELLPDVAEAPEPEAPPAAAAPAPAPRAQPTASAPAPAPAAPRAAAPASGGFVVQVSSQRSEEQAATAYRAMQRKFPGILGSQEPNIVRADLGAKGVYYRARVGPMATRDQAVSLCESLRAAGGDCIVQKN
jgi:cell division septation protein DedD